MLVGFCSKAVDLSLLSSTEMFESKTNWICTMYIHSSKLPNCIDCIHNFHLRYLETCHAPITSSCSYGAIKKLQFCPFLPEYILVQQIDIAKYSQRALESNKLQDLNMSYVPQSVLCTSLAKVKCQVCLKYMCVKIYIGSIHIWRQMFLGHFWPTYLP